MKCLCATTRHAARLLTRVYEEELRPAGITAAQFELLAALFARPDQAQSDLAELLFLDQTTLSRNMKILIGLKWVKRVASAADRRQSIYTLTAAGEKTLRKALPRWERAQGRVQRSLDVEWQAIWSSLEHLKVVAARLASRGAVG